LSLVEVFRTLVRSLASRHARALVEKTPTHLWSWPVFVADPSVKFVIIVRDPRAVVEATLRQSWAVDITEAASQWVEEQREASRLVASLGPSRARVFRYEEVVADTTGFRRGVCEFLGIGGQDAERVRAIGPDALFRDFESAWKQDAVGPVDSTRVSIWRERLTPAQISTIDAICKPMMTEYGYPRVGGAPTVSRVKRFRTSIHVGARSARQRYAALRCSGHGETVQAATLAAQYRSVETFWAARAAIGNYRERVATRSMNRDRPQ